MTRRAFSLKKLRRSQYLGYRFEEMIAQIGKLNRDRLTVVARSSIAKYKESKLTAKEIGRELNADYLVEGSIRRWSNRVRITVQLIDAKNQTDLWTESFTTANSKTCWPCRIRSFEASQVRFTSLSRKSRKRVWQILGSQLLKHT